MRKRFCIFALVGILLMVLNWTSMLNASTAADSAAGKESGVSISIDGKITVLRKDPVVFGKLVFIPMRQLFVNSGYVTEQDQATGSMIYKKGSTVLTIPLDLTKINKNGFIFECNNNLQLIDETLMVSQDLAERLLNVKINYDVKNKLVIVESKDKPTDPYGWAKDNTLIAHAAGGFHGLAYTNCYDAFENNYREGYRVFEVDLLLTSDDRMVARHDWQQYLYSLFKQELPATPVDAPITYEEFKKRLINNYMKPLDFEDIVRMMSVHKDIYIVTDTKSKSAEETTKQFKVLVDTAKKLDASVLKRIIPQVYDELTYKAVKAVYSFDSYIYTLYQVYVSNDKVVKFASENNIKVVTMDKTRYTEAFGKSLADKGIHTYVHTVNSISEIKDFKSKGVHGLYSDYITPDYMRLNGIF